MFDKTLVTVNYTGNIKHHVNEQHSRYIRAEERKELKEEFKGGIKPLTKYLEVVKKHTPEELVSGNIDGFGKNSRVYAQIACESRQEARRSDNILSSLLSQQHDMKKDCPTGFIQKICAKPLYVIYWSKGGLALYHERAASNALFWDATGSVCRRSDDGKQMLYYELAIRHPVKGKMGIPVTAMVSSDQSLPIISDWLKSFRHGEKKQFGYNKVVTPKLIISDQAMVFILAALQEFNGEDMNSFLSRAWDIINEKSPYDPSKTLVHLCASHFMNTCKKYIEKKVGKKNKAAYLYMIGLLMNCRSIHDAGEILLDIFVILQSPTLNNVNISNYDRLKRKINSYETSSEQFGINEPTGINDCSDTNTNTNLFTEEEYQAAGTSSKFREWANNVAQKAQLITDKMDCSQPTSNSWYSPDFYQYLKNKLMPIYPLWSLILMTIPGFNLDIVKTNSTVENRFRILKYIGLNSRSQYRIDEFSDALYTQTVAIQKLSCLESLKFRSNVKLTRKKTYEARQPGKKVRQETTEHWNKKKSQPINFKNKQGKYQKAPAIEIGVESPVIRRKSFPRKQTKEDVILDINPTISSDCHVSAENNKKLETSQMAVENFHSNLCTMLNFGATCWFNSLLQSLSASNFSKRIISKVLANKSINVDVEPGCKEIAIKSIGDLLWHMATEGKGKRVPKELLSSTLQNVVNAIPGFTQTRQQDVHEFNTGLISDISDQLKEHIELISTSICSNCKNKHSHKIKDGQSLVFNVIPEVDNISVQTLADNLLREGIRTQKCSHCNREEPHDMKNTIIATPRTLLVVLSRYATSGNCIKKLHNNIDVNEQLTIQTERGSVMYKLKSMVCHQGDSTNSVHYTAVVKTGTGFVCCDDLHLYNVGKDYTLNTAYVIVYDKEDGNIPAFVEPFIECFSNSTSLKKLLADRKMKHHFLMNCRSIHDAGEILLDIFVILQSPTLNNVNISNYDRLKRKINSYETSSEQFGINEPTGINDCSDTNTNTNLFTEEEYQAAGTSSKFREWANNVAQKAQLITDKMDCSQPTSNSWYSPDFYQYLKNKLMPIYPLWSLILMTIPGFNLDIVKTNSTVENRFRILKYIGLNSRSQYRIDEFSDALYTQTVAIQKLSCLESLKFRSNVKLTRKKTYEARQPGKKVRQETTEHWNKKKSQPINFKNKQGKYQKAPAIEIGVESPVIRRKSFPRKQTKEDVILDINPTISSDCHVSAENNKKLETSQMAVENFHSNLCTMLNFGATCWFNSLLQSLSASIFSKRIISKVLANKSINVDVEPGCKEIAIKSIGDLLWHMATEGKGKRVPKELLSSTLQNVVNAIPGFTQTRQQDVHEFNTGLISDISDQLKEHIELISTSICSNCKNKHSHKIKDGQSLVFNVIPEVDNISVQTLADNLLREGIRTQKCSHCNREEPHDMKNTIIATPRTLLVVLSRYATSGNCIKKLHNNIDVNEQLTIQTERGSVMYKLKSMVCHQGDSTHSGHYTAVVKTGTGFVCCDDLHLYNVGKDYTLNTAYVIVYDKEDGNIPAFVEPFIECFSNSTSLKKLLADRKMKHHNKSKTAFLTDLMKHGFSEDVKNDFLTYFLPFVETQLNMSIQDLTLELFFEAFIKHILYVGSPVGPLLSAEYLELCSKHIWKCCTCGLLDIENDNSLLLALDKFNSCAIEKNIRQIKVNRVLKQCQCNKNTRKTIITSIPTSIVIHVKNCKDLTNASLDKLDLKHLLIPHIENDSTNFKLDMILCRDGNTYFSAKNNSGEIYKTDMENFSRQPIALANLSEVTLFYNKSVETGFIDEYMNRLVKTDFKMNNTTMMPRVLKSQPGTNVQNTLINGVRINKRFLSTITNPKMWLTSDNINVYMHLLSQDSTKKVHIVDSSWFSHSLLKNNNPENIELLLTKTESKKSWFDFELIVIPVNECNRHWTLVVVSIKEKSVIFCDSYSSNSSANEISFQIMRYLQFESVMHTGQILNLNDWKFSLMNYMEKFPFQTDGSSCGVYVCAMARAIIYNTALPTENNLISFRRLMANEISLGYLQ